MALLRSIRPVAPITRGTTWEAHEWLEANGRSDLLGLGAVANAIALPSFFRGLHMRQTTLSTLPIVAERGGRTLRGPLPPILEQPDPLEDRQTTLSRMETSMTLRGEFVAVLGDWVDGWPNALTVIDPVDAQLTPEGSWLINGTAYRRDEVLHGVPMMLAGEGRGVSVVELFRRTLSGEIAASEFHRRFYLDGGLPTTVVAIDDPDLTPADLDMYRQSWRQKVAGSREPVFIPGNTKVSPLFISNRDAQWLEGRQWSITDIANIVGVPPYYLGAPGSSSTYSNASDERRAFLDFYLRSDMYCIERQLTRCLPGDIMAKFFTESFLRLDPKATADMLLVESNWMTIDEIRAVQGMPPLPNELGKVLLAQLSPGASMPGSPPAPGGTPPNPDEGGEE